jgi:hypothetical protein
MRYIGSFGISLATALLVYFFLLPLEKSSDTVQLRIQATVEHDDFFRVYYLKDTLEQFSEDVSLRQNVTGQEEPQWITFAIPYDSTLGKFRIDPGRNDENDIVRLHKIILKPSSRNVDTLALVTDFSRNNCLIPIGQGTYQMSAWNGRFNPQLISEFEIKDYVRSPRISSLFAGSPFRWAMTFCMGLLMLIRSWFFNWNAWRWWQLAFVAGFLGLVLVPVIFPVFDWEPDVQISEKRKLSERPVPIWNADYTRAFDKYYQDQFGMRNWMVKTAGYLKLDLFRVSPRPERAQMGKNGFLFFVNYPSEAFDNYTHRDVASEIDLEIYAQRERYLADFMEERDMQYVRTFWPNKHSVYPEQLPTGMALQMQAGPSLAAQAEAHLANQGMKLINVLPHLLQQKDQFQLYQKLDTHWNFHGAYAAYEAFCKLSQKELGMTPFPRDSFRIVYSETPSGDLTKIMGVDSLDQFSDQIPRYIPDSQIPGFKRRDLKSRDFPPSTTITECPGAADDRTVMVFRDSYTGVIMPFWSRHFTKVIYIWQTTVDLELVEREQPDVVISAPLERFLGELVF